MYIIYINNETNYIVEITKTSKQLNFYKSCINNSKVKTFVKTNKTSRKRFDKKINLPYSPNEDKDVCSIFAILSSLFHYCFHGGLLPRDS